MPGSYDVAIVGGGLGGATLGLNLSRAGMRVAVFEREIVYRDRVRGEGIFPWGCAEAKALGIFDILLTTCARELPFWTIYRPDGAGQQRDLRATTPTHLGMLNFQHEQMQEALAEQAVAAGVTFIRGATVTTVTPGAPPQLTVRRDEHEETVTARLVVGADGRASRVRGAAGFEVRRDPVCLVISSTLHDGLDLAEDSIHVAPNPAVRRTMLIYPVGAGRCRTYLMYRHADRAHRFSGERDAAVFLDTCRTTGQAAWFAEARQVGLLASFETAPSWVEHPARDNVVLIGDAAGASDPCYGCGLSLTLRDVRVLRDALLAEDDWNVAAQHYARAHDEYFGAMKRITDWRTELFQTDGPESDARRARAMATARLDPSVVPDLQGVGPDAPSDDAARRRYFGEA